LPGRAQRSCKFGHSQHIRASVLRR
jgi:hypothetical protein